MAEPVQVIVSEDRDGRSGREQLQRDLLAALSERPDLRVTVTPHLYDLAPDGPTFEQLRSIAGDLVVFSWLYPRAAFWVLDANRITGRLGLTSSISREELDDGSPREEPEGQRTIWCFDLRSHDRVEPYLAELERIVGPVPQPVEAMAGNGHGAELAEPARIGEAAGHRWYPVIDYDRCTDCLECLNFCLFGVFGLDESESILVEQPDACRDGCPACSRICPAGAIMFPAHSDPAIAGDPSASAGELKLDLSQLFSGADPHDLAAAERQRALDEKRRQQTEQPKPEPDASAPGLDDLVDEIDEMDL
jgi:NAD-dependent dihydropyrimidine dehydrogenase PreA subunit